MALLSLLQSAQSILYNGRNRTFTRMREGQSFQAEESTPVETHIARKKNASLHLNKQATIRHTTINPQN